MKESLDDYLTLSITDCKRLGYFRKNATVQGKISWNRNGKKCAEIGFGTNLVGVPVAVFAFSYMGKPKDQTVYLRHKHSNLTTNSADNESGYYYFVCPVTGVCCRKLYLSNDGVFVSRQALRVPYRQQTKSHAQRSGLFAYLDAMFKLDTLVKEKNRRYTYNGNLTPYGRRLERARHKYERFNLSAFLFN